MTVLPVAGDLEAGFHKTVDKNVGRQFVVLLLKSYR